jgi:hypothetical protein
MATKIQKTRRIIGIAVGAVKAIFRTGRAWGTARTRAATLRRPAPTVSTGAAVVAGAAGGAAGAYLLDPHQGKRRRQAVLARTTALVRRGEAERPGEPHGAANGAGPGANGASAETAPTKETVAAGG